MSYGNGVVRKGTFTRPIFYRLIRKMLPRSVSAELELVPIQLVQMILKQRPISDGDQMGAP